MENENPLVFELEERIQVPFRCPRGKHVMLVEGCGGGGAGGNGGAGYTSADEKGGGGGGAGAPIVRTHLFIQMEDEVSVIVGSGGNHGPYDGRRNSDGADGEAGKPSIVEVRRRGHLVARLKLPGGEGGQGGRGRSGGAGGAAILAFGINGASGGAGTDAGSRQGSRGSSSGISALGGEAGDYLNVDPSWGGPGGGGGAAYQPGGKGGNSTHQIDTGEHEPRLDAQPAPRSSGAGGGGGAGGDIAPGGFGGNGGSGIVKLYFV